MCFGVHAVCASIKVCLCISVCFVPVDNGVRVFQEGPDGVFQYSAAGHGTGSLLDCCLCSRQAEGGSAIPAPLLYNRWRKLPPAANRHSSCHQSSHSILCQESLYNAVLALPKFVRGGAFHSFSCKATIPDGQLGTVGFSLPWMSVNERCYQL